MFLLLNILICSVIIFLSYYLTRKSSNKKWLPGPTQIPFFGCALQIAWSSLKYKNFEIFEEYCKRYGPVVGLQAGLQYIVVIEDFETAKTVLFSEDWSGRMPDHPMYQELTFNKNIGIMFGFHNGWKENRRFVLKNLREYGFGSKSTMEFHLTDEVRHFLKSFEKARKQNNEICMHQCFKLASLNILWRTLCGTRLDENDETIRYFIARIEDTVVNTKIGSQPKYAFPFLRHIPYLTDAQYQIEGMKIVQDYFKNILNDRRKQGDFRIRQNDFMDMYLLKIEETKHISNTIFTDEQLIQSCTDMFLAGADTTGATLEFAMLYMLKFPEVQRKVHDEIDKVIITNDQIPSLDFREKMPYTEAVLLETLRYGTTVPVIPRSCCMTETTINGYYIPKNSLAVINAYKINHDAKIWNNPEEFKPERFLDGNGIILKDVANQMLSFGAGKRLCVGITTAKASLFTFFTTFLQRYKIEPSASHPDISLKSVVSGINNQPKPYTCMVKLRKRRSMESSI